MNFPERVYCEEIGREAWGYIDYREPLENEDIENYELIEGNEDDKSEWKYGNYGRDNVRYV